MSLRLLLGSRSRADDEYWANIDWRSFIKVADRNLISIRCYDTLKGIGVKLDAEFDQSIRLERKRIHSTTSLIGMLNSVCLKEGIKHVFLKSLQHYPDMGHDIDLLIMDNSRRFDDVLVREHKAIPLLSNLVNALSLKSDFIIDSCVSPIEIHHGRLGHVGEHLDYPNYLVKNCKMAALNDICIPVPSPEDQLLIQALQRIYYHFYFRISDLVCSIKLLEMSELNWNYIIDTADKINVIEGLIAYLSYVNEAYCSAFSGTILPAHIWKTFKFGKYKGLTFRNSYFRYPMLPVTINIYLKKIVKDIESGQFAAALRSSLMPAFGIYYLAKNIGHKRSRYFG